MNCAVGTATGETLTHWFSLSAVITKSSSYLVCLAILGLLAISCSKGDSIDLVGLAITQPTSTQHFKLTRETVFSYGSNSAERYTELMFFVAPESWRLTGDNEFQTEIILIGNRAWHLDQGQWRESNADSVRATTLAFVNTLSLYANSEDAEFIGKGPLVGSEPTLKMRLDLPDFGEISIQAFEDAAQKRGLPTEYVASEKEILSGTVASVDLLIGQDSKRIYQAKLTWNGSNTRGEQKYTFDYDTPVVISAPDR
jgi:hypothetical protein